MSSKIRIKRICLHCKNVFTAKTTVTKYCSHTCNRKAYKQRKKLEKLNQSKEEVKKEIEQPLTDIQAKDFLSIKDVCKLFGISRTTVWRLAKSGKVKTAKIGQRVFFLRSSIDAMFTPSVEEPKEKEIEYDIMDCYHIGEVQALFNVSEKALYEILKRFDVPKFQKGKYVFVPKDRVKDIFGEPEN